MTPHYDTVSVIQTVHDTVRDTVVSRIVAEASVWQVLAQLVLAAAALLATIVFGVPGLWRWIENGRPPRVSVRLDLDSNEMIVPDRHNVWGRDTHKRYAVIRVENRRGEPLSITGLRIDSTSVAYPIWIQAVNKPRVLEAKEATHYHIEMEQLGDPAKASFTLMTHGWQKTYRFT